MKVLVTGASGMLGRAVATALAERGDRVTVIQRRPAGLPFSEVLADVSDQAAVREAARGQDAVVHLAAKVDITGRWADYVSANIEGTRSVVAACLAVGVPRLVHVSSPSVAHTGASLVGADGGAAEPTRARGHYARSKAIAERLALAADDGLAVVAVRPHLVWGPGDTQLVGRVVHRARTGRLALVGSGAALVDSTYVSNAADALIAAVDRCTEARGEVVVVTNGEPRPIAELVISICAAAGVPAPRRHVPAPVARAAGGAIETVWAALQRPGEPPMTRFLAEQLSTAHWFDQRRTRHVLRWTPEVSLDEGFERLARSFRGQGE